MDEIICIKSGDCVFHIRVDGLPRLTLRQVKGLFCCLYQDQWQNQETLAVLDRRLPQLVGNTSAAWEAASLAYTTERRYVANPRKRDPNTLESVKHNAALRARVKQTKAAYDRWNKIEKIYSNLK